MPAIADEAAVARGGYLAAVAGCDQCHTDSKNGGAPYAGGRPMNTEFGTIVTPNITPDRATGIGGWSDADFIRAMRWGIAPDGTHYLPAFPFRYFARLTDSDLGDLRAFLATLPPASHPRVGGPLTLLARARAAVGLAVESGSTRLAASSAEGSVVARGAYLVATVGHCGDCHTPLTWLGAPDRDRFLAGSNGGIEGNKAPNITPDPKTGTGNWSTDDIVYLLKEGGTPDGDFIGGSMSEIVRNTARLTNPDRRAIAAYLKTVPAKAFIKHE